VELSPGKHTFADDYFIESLHGARRVLGTPEKLTVDGPIDIVLDQPWDAEVVLISPAVYDDELCQFRIYYNVWAEDRLLICALVSEDGLTWERPKLGLVEWAGSKNNNITNCPPGGLMTFCDPYAIDATQRWKRIDNKPTGTKADGSPQWLAFHSKDGFDWRAYPSGEHSDQQMLFNFGSPGQSFGGYIDPDARYIYYSQRGSGRRTRIMGRRDSVDGLNWSGLRTVIDQDLDDPPGTEFYGAGFDVANRTDGGLHTMMLQTFLSDISEPLVMQDPGSYWGQAEPGPAAVAARVDGHVDTQLAFSRDTVSWTRYRQPFLQRGIPGSWDGGMLYGDAPILHNDRLWLFYSATDLSHNGRSHRPDEGRYPQGKNWGKGLAQLRPDGWVSIEAESFAPGQLTTHRFRQEDGGRISVNVDASAGELHYELLHDTGAPITGYGLQDCDPIRTDTLSTQLSWNGKPGWPAKTEDRSPGCEDLIRSEFYVKLRFHIAPATKFYALTIAPPEVTMWQVHRSDRPRRID